MNVSPGDRTPVRPMNPCEERVPRCRGISVPERPVRTGTRPEGFLGTATPTTHPCLVSGREGLGCSRVKEVRVEGFLSLGSTGRDLRPNGIE